MRITISVIGALVVLILFRILSRIRADRRDAAEAKRRGCKEPIRQKHRLPLALDLVQAALQADRQQLYPDMVIRRFKDVQAWTYSDAILGARRAYFTCEPENIQAMLSTQFHDFAIGDRRRGIVLPLLGRGIFTEDGRAWAHSRALMRPHFAREQISDLRLEESHVQNMMLALPVDETGWTSSVVDLQDLFFRLTLDSATEFLFGESANVQLAELPEALRPAQPSAAVRVDSSAQDEVTRRFAEAFDLGQKWIAKRARFSDKYWLVTSREFRSACKQTHEFVDRYVRLALRDDKGSSDKEAGKSHGEKEKEKEEVKRYVLMKALAAEVRDPIQLRSQLLNILLAGRDSTASHLGWLFYLLARHPAVFQKLRKVVMDTFGTSHDPRDITFIRLKACKYLEYCNNETMRLYPVLPVNSRQAVRDTTLPRGGGNSDGRAPIFVAKDQLVVYSTHAMHRRKDLWGIDADEFKPDRWEGLKPSWNFAPFGGGPRICLGRMYSPRTPFFLKTYPSFFLTTLVRCGIDRTICSH